ncbi:TIGR01777 family oxidoreductase [Sulfoacidibacillus thermotolerans]|uniref:TIGR01777 family oxidoreductase n=1 Tax=Sulfoacidibacillus thermotolerans TaxID=1765684 RepID=UPI0015E828C3|nr:TIGR01777 family oxidoreductase [Sulfoacidibacillus thermotolerans]
MVFGGTGFLGKALVQELASKHRVFVVSRKPSEHQAELPNIEMISLHDFISYPNKLPTCHIYINLAGASISKRWSVAYKRKILESRLEMVDFLTQYLVARSQHEGVLLQASAIGFYGTSLNDTFEESSSPKNVGFLHEVVSKWEEKSSQIEQLGLRVIRARLGVVFGNDGGVFPTLVHPYRYYLGGPLGTGDQWVSWIHIKDTLRMFSWAIDHPTIQGIINVTAPYPVHMNDLAREIATCLQRPSWVKIPPFLLHALLGERANLVLEGQRVIPDKAIKNGFSFLYPTVQSAVCDLLKRTF